MYLCGKKIFAKSFSGWGADRNIIKISCHSRLFFVLHLLVNRITILTIARNLVEHVFILIQFFFYLRKQGWLFSFGALKRIHPWVRLNGLFDFYAPSCCQKIKDFLMVLGEGPSLIALLELVLYDFVVLGVFHLCYVGIPLIFWDVPLFRRCSVFRSSVFRRSRFYSMPYKVLFISGITAPYPTLYLMGEHYETWNLAQVLSFLCSLNSRNNTRSYAPVSRA